MKEFSREVKESSLWMGLMQVLLNKLHMCIFFSVIKLGTTSTEWSPREASSFDRQEILFLEYNLTIYSNDRLNRAPSGIISVIGSNPVPLR
jgi:hypothetical protein